MRPRMPGERRAGLAEPVAERGAAVSTSPRLRRSPRPAALDLGAARRLGAAASAPRGVGGRSPVGGARAASSRSARSPAAAERARRARSATAARSEDRHQDDRRGRVHHGDRRAYRSSLGAPAASPARVDRAGTMPAARRGGGGAPISYVMRCCCTGKADPGLVERALEARPQLARHVATARAARSSPTRRIRIPLDADVLDAPAPRARRASVAATRASCHMLVGRRLDHLGRAGRCRCRARPATSSERARPLLRLVADPRDLRRWARATRRPRRRAAASCAG